MSIDLFYIFQAFNTGSGLLFWALFTLAVGSHIGYEFYKVVESSNFARDNLTVLGCMSFQIFLAFLLIGELGTLVAHKAENFALYDFGDEVFIGHGFFAVLFVFILTLHEKYPLVVQRALKKRFPLWAAFMFLSLSLLDSELDFVGEVFCFISEIPQFGANDDFILGGLDFALGDDLAFSRSLYGVIAAALSKWLLMSFVKKCLLLFPGCLGALSLADSDFLWQGLEQEAVESALDSEELMQATILSGSSLKEILKKVSSIGNSAEAIMQQSQVKLAKSGYTNWDAELQEQAKKRFKGYRLLSERGDKTILNYSSKTGGYRECFDGEFVPRKKRSLFAVYNFKDDFISRFSAERGEDLVAAVSLYKEAAGVDLLEMNFYLQYLGRGGLHSHIRDSIYWVLDVDVSDSEMRFAGDKRVLGFLNSQTVLQLTENEHALLVKDDAWSAAKGTFGSIPVCSSHADAFTVYSQLYPEAVLISGGAAGYGDFCVSIGQKTVFVEVKDCFYTYGMSVEEFVAKLNLKFGELRPACDELFIKIYNLPEGRLSAVEAAAKKAFNEHTNCEGKKAYLAHRADLIVLERQ